MSQAARILKVRRATLSDLLHGKGIPHNLDLWGTDVDHSLPWWGKMLPFYLAEKVRW